MYFYYLLRMKQIFIPLLRGCVLYFGGKRVSFLNFMLQIQTMYIKHSMNLHFKVISIWYGHYLIWTYLEKHYLTILLTNSRKSYQVRKQDIHVFFSSLVYYILTSFPPSTPLSSLLPQLHSSSISLQKEQPHPRGYQLNVEYQVTHFPIPHFSNLQLSWTTV